MTKIIIIPEVDRISKFQKTHLILEVFFKYSIYSRTTNMPMKYQTRIVMFVLGVWFGSHRYGNIYIYIVIWYLFQHA